MKLRQFDTVTVRAVVELPKPAGGGIGIILKGMDGRETRAVVDLDAIESVEAGPLQPGDEVSRKPSKGKAKGPVGVVISRDGDQAWVRFADASTVEAITDLIRE